jgi:hypothetical protein
MRTNSQFPWDEFDTTDYVKHNYTMLRDDDRQIVCFVRDFFSTVPLVDQARGIDVGAGPNLYPALTMLPLCQEITLWERSEPNVEWLQAELDRLSEATSWSESSAAWGECWRVLRVNPTYGRVESPRKELKRKARTENESVFDLPAAEWDIGTMFFVAESISEEWAEFQKAAHRFVRALKPGAPFAAAFMSGSRGWEVGDHRFPSVYVGEDDVRRCLAVVADGVRTHVVSSAEPLREDYDGHMILALGRAGRA